jgi:outer membrane protein assembly factor BamB
MASAERNLPVKMSPGVLSEDERTIKPGSERLLKWVAKLGSQAYGNPVVADGRVFVGTNNAIPRNPGVRGDRGIIMVFDESTGAFLWQLAVPKLGAGKVNDWEYLGICSSPAIENDRAYVITNRGEVMALDTRGLANGNQGSQEESKLGSVRGHKFVPGPKDADIIWVYNMPQELAVFPHNITSSSALIVGDKLFVTTSNGVDWSHRNIPSPMAPSLIVLDKKTGKLVGEDASGISERVLHATWSSPASAKVKNKTQIFFGAGDGFCYGFDPVPTLDKDGFQILKELWRFDVNPAEYRNKDGKPIRYTRRNGPSEIIATPVFYEGHVYALIGQDPEHGSGLGNLACIDPTKRGNISKTGKVWSYDGIKRSISTVAIWNGLVFAADLDGKIHCLDAKTGKVHWVHNTGSRIWSSPIVADGKVYLGNEDGVLIVLTAGKKLEVLHTAEFSAPIYSSIIAANGAIYVASQTHLYAFANPAKASKKARKR